MPKKKFIDKKKAVTFHLVHRSQHDPLTADETAPQHILVPTAVENSTKKTKEELVRYGIYFDDDYNYLQHLRDVNQTELEFAETQKTSKPEKQKLNLPSSVFASAVEEKVGLLNKAAPESGLKLDLDPDIVAAMDEDFDYSNPENELEDNFMELANAAVSGSEEYVDEPGLENSENNYSDCSSELNDEVESLKEIETGSRFTDYSMTSSVISRNSQLTLLDETFEQMFADYDETEIGALDWDEIEGELDVDSQLFQKAANDFIKERQVEKLTVEEIQKVIVDSSDESNAENEYCFEVKDEKKWDCESILSRYSNIYNHPKLIKDASNKIQVNKKTGIPVESGKLTKKALSQLDDSTGNQGPSSIISVLSTLSIRHRNESPEEKKKRKRQLKEYRKARRVERKMNTQAFKEENKRLEKTMIHNKLNRQGIVL